MPPILQAAVARERISVKQLASQYLSPVLPGIGLCCLVGVAAAAAGHSRWLQAYGMSPIIIAMVVGIVISNLCARLAAGRCAPGIHVCKHFLLRAGVALYGFRLTFSDIGTVGWTGVAVDALMLTSTIGLALVVGITLLKMERNTVLLIGAGSSICGAAAVIATEPVVKGRPDQVAVAVATAVLFGTFATVLYPYLYRLNLDSSWLPTSAAAFGLYAGSTIHEVAQVIAAAKLADPAAVDPAVIAKMVRVMMLPLFLVALSCHIRFWQQPDASDSGMRSYSGMTGALRSVHIPWFAAGFLLVVAINSMLNLSPTVRGGLIAFDTILLTVGMAALGLSTHYSCFQKAGKKAMMLGAALFLWLTVGGAWINYMIPKVLDHI